MMMKGLSIFRSVSKWAVSVVYVSVTATFFIHSASGELLAADRRGESIVVRGSSEAGGFPLFTPDFTPAVIVDEAEAEVVKIAASAFGEDMVRLGGPAPELLGGLSPEADRIILFGS